MLGNYLAVADVEGIVHFLSRDDGAFVARQKTDGSADGEFELEEEVVIGEYQESSGGDLMLDLDLGSNLAAGVDKEQFSRMGISEAHLLEPCVGTYVAAWHLGRQLRRHGENWWGVGSYHSLTPQHNRRYQVLVYNEMVRAGALPGPVRPVPARQP